MAEHIATVVRGDIGRISGFQLRQQADLLLDVLNFLVLLVEVERLHGDHLFRLVVDPAVSRCSANAMEVEVESGKISTL